jgi:hypothetical protein
MGQTEPQCLTLFFWLWYTELPVKIGAVGSRKWSCKVIRRQHRASFQRGRALVAFGTATPQAVLLPRAQAALREGRRARRIERTLGRG